MLANAGFTSRPCVGDANRSAAWNAASTTSRHLSPGRTFLDLRTSSPAAGLVHGRQCEPREAAAQGVVELLVAERGALQPLPLHVPEVYEPHRRRVGVDGYITLHTNRYPIEDVHIGRELEVHETVDRVRLFDGHKLIAEYGKLVHGRYQRVPVPEGMHRRDAAQAEATFTGTVLRAVDPAVGNSRAALKKRDGGARSKTCAGCTAVSRLTTPALGRSA